MAEFKPKIIAFCCNSAFFFGAKFSAVVENIPVYITYVFHYLVEDSHGLNLIPVHHDGSGSQRKTWGKKKLALACSNFAFNINYGGV